MPRRNDKTKFRQYLDSKDISTAEFAIKAGISSNMAYNYIQGYTQPNNKRVQKFLEVLGCKYEDLY